MSMSFPFRFAIPARAACALIGVTTFAAIAVAHDHDKDHAHNGHEHRELGAHVHGRGTFNIAIEGNRVALELQAPGMDIVGFESAPASDTQKAAVETAKATLAKPLELFAAPAAAKCAVTETKVELEGGAAHSHDHAGHDHSGHDHADHKHDNDAHDHADHKHDHAKHDHDHDHSGAHAEFRATYTLECANPSALTSLTFDYFKAFAGAQSLAVNVIAEKGQSTFEATREKPGIDLGGLM